MSEDIKLTVSCPVCGKVLFKSQSAKEIEVICPKCKHNIVVNNFGRTLSICLEEMPEYGVKNKI